MKKHALFFVILVLILTMVYCQTQENFTASEEKEINSLKEMVKNVGTDFNKALENVTNMKFKGFQGPRGVPGAQGPAGGQNISYSPLANFKYSRQFPTTTYLNNDSIIYFSDKPVPNNPHVSLNTQKFQYTKDRQIQSFNGNNCINVKDDKVLLGKCDSSWEYTKDNEFKNNNKCLSVGPYTSTQSLTDVNGKTIPNENLKYLIVEDCNSSPEQKWNL